MLKTQRPISSSKYILRALPDFELLSGTMRFQDVIIGCITDTQSVVIRKDDEFLERNTQCSYVCRPTTSFCVAERRITATLTIWFKKGN